MSLKFNKIPSGVLLYYQRLEFSQCDCTEKFISKFHKILNEKLKFIYCFNFFLLLNLLLLILVDRL